MSYVSKVSRISFRFLNIFTCVMNIFFTIFFGYTIINRAGDGLTLSSIFLFGFFNISYFSICYQHGVSLTPRFGEAISTGLINVMANLCGFIQTFVWAYFDINIDHDGLVYVLMSVVIMLGLAILIFVTIAEKRTINTNNLIV